MKKLIGFAFAGMIGGAAYCAPLPVGVQHMFVNCIERGAKATGHVIVEHRRSIIDGGLCFGNGLLMFLYARSGHITEQRKKMKIWSYIVGTSLFVSVFFDITLFSKMSKVVRISLGLVAAIVEADVLYWLSQQKNSEKSDGVLLEDLSDNPLPNDAATNKQSNDNGDVQVQLNRNGSTKPGTLKENRQKVENKYFHNGE